MNINEWTDIIVRERQRHGFETNWTILAEKTMLIVTELGRAVDGHREKNNMLVYHELTDALVRLLDLMGSIGMNVDNHLRNNMNEWRERPYKHNKEY